MWDDFCDFCGLVLRVAAVLVVALGLLVVMSRCGEEREVFDPYAGCPSTPDTRTASVYAVARHSEAPWLGAGADDADGYALEVYEYEMLANSLPPCGE